MTEISLCKCFRDNLTGWYRKAHERGSRSHKHQINLKTITKVSAKFWIGGILPAWQCWWKIQNTQEIKRTLVDWTKQDKTCTFSRKSSFSSYVQQQKQKNKQLIQLILCQLDARRLAEGKGHETHVCFGPVRQGLSPLRGKISRPLPVCRPSDTVSQSVTVSTCPLCCICGSIISNSSPTHLVLTRGQWYRR